MANSSIPCNLCQKPVNIWTQPAMYPGGIEREYGECRNPDCCAHGITLTVDNLKALTAEIAARYTKPAI